MPKDKQKKEPANIPALEAARNETETKALAALGVWRDAESRALQAVSERNEAWKAYNIANQKFKDAVQALRSAVAEEAGRKAALAIPTELRPPAEAEAKDVRRL